MHRFLLIPALLLASGLASAQRVGGRGPAGFSSHGVLGSAGAAHGFTRGRSLMAGRWQPPSGRFRPRLVDRRFGRDFRYRNFDRRRYPWASYGYYIDPWLYDSDGSLSDDGVSSEDSGNSRPQSGFALQQEVNQLRQEVSDLHAQRDGYRPPDAEPEPASHAGIDSGTVLVFQDKHTEQVWNYAIVAGTLWIFHEGRASKIPLAALDIPATAKANEDRGVDFRVPG